MKTPDAINDTLTTLVFHARDLGGPFLEAAEKLDEFGEPWLALVVTFFELFNPLGENSPMNAIADLVNTIVRIYLSIFLFGCSQTLDPDNCDADPLPSELNTIIKVKEDRNGDLYLASGTLVSGLW